MKLKPLSIYVCLTLGTLLILSPIIWMFLISIRDNVDVFRLPLQIIPDEPNIQAYIQIFNNSDMFQLFINSYIIALSVTCICVLFAALAGFGLSRFSYKGKKYLVIYTLLTQMFPMVLLAIPYFLVISSLGLYNSYIALIIAYTSFALPFAILMMRDFMNSIPRELDDAAKIDGCGLYRTFFSVILPPSLPGLIAMAIYTFILAWNEYLFAIVLTQNNNARPLTVGIGMLMGEFTTEWNQLMALSILGSLPLIIVFLFIQRYFLQGLTSGSVK
ncbi:carbohydrate ABC transporter permease [Gracilibacillus alcaliphilus]|uniref:carbohydrate ABC transporter permease n=1 Tax=Gracilibacillus alcaliphilus TaxID=1401441 RepID=UPI00195D71CF|nr:carbohydrate ABC transporter permease [Gracilibacillus alcaliphilus]MBM7677154.1 multiple sugar transport system permease protein [Gracilibacillus alcaliphilus]